MEVKRTTIYSRCDNNVSAIDEQFATPESIGAQAAWSHDDLVYDTRIKRHLILMDQELATWIIELLLRESLENQCSAFSDNIRQS